MPQPTPYIKTTTLANAQTTSGSFVYDLRGVTLATLQLHATWDVSDTTTVTLKLSVDNANFDGFASAKTLSVNGTTDGIFELGALDYPFLQVSWTTPAANHQLTLVGNLYAAASDVQTR